MPAKTPLAKMLAVESMATQGAEHQHQRLTGGFVGHHQRRIFPRAVGFGCSAEHQRRGKRDPAASGIARSCGLGC